MGRTPIEPAADVATSNITLSKFIDAGDPRYLPTGSGLTMSKLAGLAQPARPENHTPASVRQAGYTTTSDSSAGDGNINDLHGPASVYVGDTGAPSVGGVPLPDTVHYSVDQRDAGPANRWSIYGVDPRYPPPLVEGPEEDAGPPHSPFASLPPEAYTGYPGDGYTVPGYVPQFMREPEGSSEVVIDDDGGMSDPSVLVDGSRVGGDCNTDWGQSPLPLGSCGPWKPPGISGPWPEDEYLFDGGDSDGGVKVRADGQLEGLDSEDTIAHYQTLNGRICVKPTNRVCLYAPRFAAIRQVTLAYGDNQLERAGGVDMPIGPVPEQKVQPVSTALQPVQPIGEIGHRAPITFLEHTPPLGLVAQTVVRATVDRLKPYENFDFVRSGLLMEGEKPFIARSIDAAVAWTTNVGVQVEIGGVKAIAIQSDKRAQATYGIDTPDHPCLRVCKLASTHSALPGETVEFTIRFDNVGDQPVGNVTIADNLTTRLELVPGSGQCSKDAKFFSEPNKQGSLILHWEISQPLKPGEGGIARFKCIVR
ncbi:MAG TPA: hypothetical protein VFE46_06735 [Pirellulales bacterium]|nr:hypothetical protein [Pirellulales bacterium]